jgi:hypothetical protein
MSRGATKSPRRASVTPPTLLRDALTLLVSSCAVEVLA